MVPSSPNRQDPRGSRWRRWDLHVHTPYSHFQQYGSGDEAWERFLADLEGLPSDFKVIGINDYLFIDGYERVLDAKRNGRLQNLDLILPVVELRLDKFGGTDSHLSRVNYHVIFSDDLSPDEIRSQFLNQLVADYTLRDKPFKKAINKTTLAELGQELIDTAPESKRKANHDALTVGFNNITFPLSQIRELLQNTTFTNKVLTAVGKAEWADIKWQQSVADKRTIIDSADFGDYMVELEHDAAVASWTKNHGVVIPYRLLGFPHRYHPDFLVNFKDGSRELHETKGLPLLLWLSTRLKRESAEDYCRRNGWGYKLVTKGLRWR